MATNDKKAKPVAMAMSNMAMLSTVGHAQNATEDGEKTHAAVEAHVTVEQGEWGAAQVGGEEAEGGGRSRWPEL